MISDNQQPDVVPAVVLSKQVERFLTAAVLKDRDLFTLLIAKLSQLPAPAGLI